MRKAFRDFDLLVGAIVVVMFMAAGDLAQSNDKPNSTQDESLRKFLQGYLTESRPEDQEPTRFSSAFVDLNDDGTKEVIVYIAGRPWCGSGGCMMLVLTPQGSSYRVVTRATITRPPIRVLTTKSNGWYDLGVSVLGGGVQPGYEARLPFDGKTYPTNPSMFPARHLVQKVAGEVVVPATALDQGTSLY